LIAGLFPDGPAEEGDLEQGDLIIEIAGEEIESAEDLTSTLTELDPGSTVEVRVLRGGDEVIEDVELERRPTTIPLPEASP
jgi:serine protease Do